MIFTGEEYQNLSLRECFIKKLDTESFRLAREYESACVKLSRYKNHCIFNLRCKKQGVVPKSLRVPCYVKSRGHRIAEKASRALCGSASDWLREQRKILVMTRNGWRSVWKGILGSEAADKFKEFVGRKAERVFLAARDTQKRKFDILLQQRNRKSAITQQLTQVGG